MSLKIESNTVSTGLAMFSMFFGAGNIVFPLAMGQYAQDHNLHATLGFLLTAVGVPFLGLVAMTLFDGNYKAFFGRIGKVPGFLIALFIMGLIGPFGALPRVIAFSHSTAKMFTGDISPVLFSALSCLIIYLTTYKRSRILDILGYFLTPILLISLFILIAVGLTYPATVVPSQESQLSIFFYGLQQGYNTMDLLATFFFSSVVILCLKKELHPENQSDFKRLVIITLKAGCIGMSLLAIVYVGISFLASHNSQLIAGIPQDQMLGALSMVILGPYAGIVAIVAVALACLTTAIALAAVFAEFIHEDITFKKVSYQNSLILTLIASFLMSTLNFSGIMGFLVPVLTVCYPALIVLSFLNIAYKLYGVKVVKTPVLIVFLLSLAFWVYY